MKIEVLQCKDCKKIAIAVDEVRITSHKCSGRWHVVLLAQYDASEMIASAKREAAATCAAIASEVSASYDKEDGFPSHHAVGAETVAVTIIGRFGLMGEVKP